MPALQIKDCPTEVYEELRRCASRENRSISQQALTILEVTWGSEISLRTIDQCLHQRGLLEIIAIEKSRKRIFERIDKLPAIPVSELAPSSADILAEIREKEAR